MTYSYSSSGDRLDDDASRITTLTMSSVTLAKHLGISRVTCPLNPVHIESGTFEAWTQGRGNEMGDTSKRYKPEQIVSMLREADKTDPWIMIRLPTVLE